MTINIADNAARISYSVADGVTQNSFAVPFEFFDNDDLNVYVDGALKAITTDYTVSGGDGSTGTVTISVTGASGGSTVVVTRDITHERTTDFPVSGAFNIVALNTELDRIIAIAADLDDRASRSLQLTDYDVGVGLTLPVVDNRKGKTLAFNLSTGAVEAGPATSDVQSVSDASADIALLADIQDGTIATDAITNVSTIRTDVSTVSGISSDVTTVSGISANVTTVSGISSDVTTVAGVSTHVATLGPIATDITTVSSNNTNVTTVATNINAVNTVASNISNINTVANDLLEVVSEIETVANDLNEATSEIEVVANNIANVNTVGTISGNVTTVAGISADVTAVAADASDIGVVSTNIVNVNTVGGISSNVTTVAGISSDVTTVAGISANISTVAADTTNIGVVASNLNGSDTIGSVAANISNVNSVGGSISNVNTVATNLSDINNFFSVYRTGTSEPTTSLDTGDLFYNTSTGNLKIYNGTSWEAGVTAGSGFLAQSSNLSDLTDSAAARQNLGVEIGVDVQAYNSNLAAINQTLATSASPTFVAASFTGTGAIEMPSGTAAQRPSSPTNGMLRYNTDDNAFEAYADNAWAEIGGGGDAAANIDCGTASSQTGTLYDLGSASSA